MYMDIVVDVNIKIQLNKIIVKETVNWILVYRLRKVKNVSDSSKYSNLSNCTYTEHIKNDFKSIYDNIQQSIPILEKQYIFNTLFYK